MSIPDLAATSNALIALTLWMALVHRRAIAGSLGVCLAHIQGLQRCSKGEDNRGCNGFGDSGRDKQKPIEKESLERVDRLRN
jgi:hypothetical protein